MSYEFEIKVVAHPIEEEWFQRLLPLNSNLSDVISELWELEDEVAPCSEYTYGDHQFKVSGAVFVDYMDRHRPDFLSNGFLCELIAAIKKSRSPDRVELSIVVEHP